MAIGDRDNWANQIRMVMQVDVADTPRGATHGQMRGLCHRLALLTDQSLVAFPLPL
jgi:hypothetical protein